MIVFILVGHRVPKLKRTHRKLIEESSALYVKVYVSNIGSVGSITSTFIYRPI